MKDKLNGALMLTALIGGGAWLYSSGDDKQSSPRNDDYKTTRSYEEYGDRDCSDFSFQSKAQKFFENEGGPKKDFHNLDRDGDGIVCESLN